MLCDVILTATYAECHIKAPFAECRYAECPYADCRYVDCRRASLTSATQ
jgi:hypothetical protein